MEPLTKTSTNEEIKRYFEAILELRESNEEFPVNLDEVWPLVYSRKREAVRALTGDNSQFVEGVDFQSMRQNAHGGKFAATDYSLSLSCLEYFIARKVRPVFEVYRQVFHGVTTQRQLPSNYVEALEALLQSEKDKQSLLLENRSLSRENERNQPKVEFANCVMKSEDCISIAEMAQMLKQNKLANMGQNKFYEWLRFNNYLVSRGARRNLPTQRSMNLGVLRIAEDVTDKRTGVFINRKAVVPPEGQAYFVDLFKKLSRKGYRLFW